MQGLAVDPASFKLWPDGARTILNATWSPSGSSAPFNVRNYGTTPTTETRVTVTVEDHDPAGEALLGSTRYSLTVPSLDPGETATINVPVDYTQCNVYISVDLGSGSPTVLRTGDPAAC